MLFFFFWVEICPVFLDCGSPCVLYMSILCCALAVGLVREAFLAGGQTRDGRTERKATTDDSEHSKSLYSLFDTIGSAGCI